MTDLIDDIRAIVGDVGLLTGDDVSSRPASWLRDEPTVARAIVRPSSTDEVAAVIKCCHAVGQAVIPIGGNTGLVDGTVSTESDVLLSLERMNRIEAIDVTGATMRVQAGVPLQMAQQAADEHDLMLSLDLGARGSATIGGNISTNAGGNAVIRYGMMREQVLGLEAVLADGTVISSMHEMLKNNAGYDLKQLFIGTEGTLGIVTRAVLRLRPALRSHNTALVGVADYDPIPGLLHELGKRLGGALTAFEVLWADFYDTVAGDGSHPPPLAERYPFYVLIESSGYEQDDRFEEVLGDLLQQSFIDDAVIAGSERQRSALWAIRDDIDGLVRKLGPAIAFDVGLPISAAARYAEAVHRRLREKWPDSYRGTTFGHLGDGNLHFLMTVGSSDRTEQRAAMRIVYEELEPYGGSVSAEHGIGLEKRDFLKHTRSAAEIALMKSLKKALDPTGILNPGKVFEA